LTGARERHTSYRFHADMTGASARSAVSGQPSTVLIAGGGTGGHLMPALAIAAAIRAAEPGKRVVLVGAMRGVEATLLPTRAFPYHLLPAEPIYRRQWWRNVRWPFLALGLMREIGRLLERERPALVIGTGGYASGPVVWAAARRGIPTAIQEQNAFPGLATRWLSARARQVWLGVPEARRFLRVGRDTEVIDTGNPIVPPDPSRAEPARVRFGIDRTRPVALISGGSQGSVALNEAIADVVRAGGFGGATLLWATGRGSYERFRELHHPPAIQVFDFLDPMADAYAIADVAVGRAGMMTIAELCAWGIPSILIPLPTAAADHQTGNARVMAEAGAAIHLPQAELTPGRLGSALSSLLSDRALRAEMAARARARGRPDAGARIAALAGILSG
jgi:UDP-N-acetylglucosamine--N-acetylmuramyl-(pentapeptide) pyrophosphoryl-undecaprenol N-acetylglucosamine transferase